MEEQTFDRNDVVLRSRGFVSQWATPQTKSGAFCGRCRLKSNQLVTPATESRRKAAHSAGAADDSATGLMLPIGDTTSRGIDND